PERLDPPCAIRPVDHNSDVGQQGHYGKQQKSRPKPTLRQGLPFVLLELGHGTHGRSIFPAQIDADPNGSGQRFSENASGGGILLPQGRTGQAELSWMSRKCEEEKYRANQWVTMACVPGLLGTADSVHLDAACGDVVRPP